MTWPSHTDSHEGPGCFVTMLGRLHVPLGETGAKAPRLQCMGLVSSSVFTPTDGGPHIDLALHDRQVLLKSPTPSTLLNPMVFAQSWYIYSTGQSWSCSPFWNTFFMRRASLMCPWSLQVLCARKLLSQGKLEWLVTTCRVPTFLWDPGAALKHYFWIYIHSQVLSPTPKALNTILKKY